ncbi:MAG TPA: DUF2975 domain-containing protein [Niabella sp.]
MKTNTKAIISVMHVICWIVYIGLCIQAGAILVVFLISLFGNAEIAKRLYDGINNYTLYRAGKEHYIFLMTLLVIVAALKAHLFYITIRIFMKINVVNPFSPQVAKLIVLISKVACIIGILSVLGNEYTEWLKQKGFEVTQQWNGSEFLFLAGIVFVIALIFKRGVELQHENELTV